MAVDGWHMLLVFSAVAIGWLLGRWTRPAQKPDAGTARRYYQGLNFLLNDHPDGSVDAFIESLEVNSETLEMHIAVGNQMRRKGEVERAIRIHQNLLSRPSLPREHLHQAHLELARDFISAGLWDRAERLLQDLLEESSELRSVAKRHLMEIYQDEKEWDAAIDMARQILPKRTLLKSSSPTDAQLTVALSHYCCELAEEAIQKKNYLLARGQLKQALAYDPACVRASLLAADLECGAGHFSIAIKHLRRVKEQDPVFIPETIARLRQCYGALGDEEGLANYLADCLEQFPSTRVLLALADLLKTQQGFEAAHDFLTSQLKRRPSLRGLEQLLAHNTVGAGEHSRESLSMLHGLIEQIMDNKPQYQCNHCGFSGRHLHWLCPGCKQWGQIKTIRGVEGD